MAPDAPLKTPSALWGVGIVGVSLFAAGALFGFGLFGQKTTPWVEVDQGIHDTSEPLMVRSEHRQWEAKIGDTVIPIQHMPQQKGHLLTMDITSLSKGQHEQVVLQSLKDKHHTITIPIKHPVRDRYQHAATLVRVPQDALTHIEAQMSAQISAQIKQWISGSWCGIEVQKTTIKADLVDGAVRLKINIKGTNRLDIKLSLDVVLRSVGGRLMVRPKMETVKLDYATPRFSGDGSEQCKKWGMLNGVMDVVRLMSQQAFNQMIASTFKDVVMPSLDTTIKTVTRDVAIDWIDVKPGVLYLGARPRQTPQRKINWAKHAQKQSEHMAKVTADPSRTVMVNVHSALFNYALDRYIPKDTQTEKLERMIETSSAKFKSSWQLTKCKALASPKLITTKNQTALALPALRCTLTVRQDDKTIDQTLWFGARVPVKVMGSKVLMDWQGLKTWSRCHEDHNNTRVVTCAKPFDDRALFEQGIARSVPAVMELQWLYPIMEPYGITRVRGWHHHDSDRIDLEISVKKWETLFGHLGKLR